MVKKNTWTLPNELKKTYNNYRSTFTHEIYRHRTSLS